MTEGRCHESPGLLDQAQVGERLNGDSLEQRLPLHDPMSLGKSDPLLCQLPRCSWSLCAAERNPKVVIEHGRLAPKPLSRSGLQRPAYVLKPCRPAECELGAATEPERPRWHGEAEFSGEFDRAFGECRRLRMLVGQKACSGAVGQSFCQFGGG